MPSRNEPCPCGSGAKYKRCCLVRSDAIARELRQRDALLGDVVEWLKDEHEQAVDDASAETTLIRMLRGPAGRNMSLVWALNDFTPTDGGPPLMARYAARTDLDPSARELAHGLADARLGVYRVCAATAGLGFEIEPLAGGPPVRVLSEGGYADLEGSDILVARVVHATSAPTLWGLATRFEAESERRWRARLAQLPANRAQAALIVLGFHPDDAAEPLPDGLDLLTATSSIHDEDALLEALEDDSRLECLGQTTPHGWAFAWLDHAGCGRHDLGGWRDGDGEIEVARVVVSEHEMTLVSADNETLRTIASHLAETLSDLISARPDALAA